MAMAASLSAAPGKSMPWAMNREPTSFTRARMVTPDQLGFSPYEDGAIEHRHYHGAIVDTMSYQFTWNVSRNASDKTPAIFFCLSG